MYPNYNYFPQNQQPQMQNRPQQNQMLYLKGRPVSSVEEVRAIPIDFDGSIFYFPDLANRRIYTKQINLDGTASIFMYEFKTITPTPEVTQPADYVTREEFNSLLEKIFPKEKEVVTTTTTPPAPPVKKEDIKF